MRLNEMAEAVTDKITSGAKVIEIITAPGLGVHNQLEEILEDYASYSIDSVAERSKDFTTFKRAGEINLISINDSLLNAEIVILTDFEFDEILEVLSETLESDSTVFGTKLSKLKTVIKVSYDFALTVDEIVVM